MATQTIELGIPFSSTLDLKWNKTLIPATNPEGVFRATGRRPAFPLVVYSMTQDGGSISDVPANGSFVMASSYVPSPSDGMYDKGAAVGSIGTRVVLPGGRRMLVFRPPVENEVVRLVNLQQCGPQTDGGYYRWQDGMWRAYVTMPQRTLRQMNAFSVLDRDGVYDFWASLLGGLQYCLTTDAVSLTHLLDADLVPDDYLVLLGSMLGIIVPSSASPTARRYQVRTAIQRNHLRGLGQGIALRLFLMGYVGYANEVWIKPEDVDNWSALDDAPMGTQTDIADAGLTIDPNNGVKGGAWIEVGHASTAAVDALDGGYVPSSRLVIHVNNRDGSALSGSLSPGSISELKQLIARALAEDVLPAQASIRFFATDDDPDTFRYL